MVLLFCCSQVRADTVDTFAVNATYAPGEILNATLVVNLSTDEVISFQGTFVDPRFAPNQTLSVTGGTGACEALGVDGGCVGWAAGTAIGPFFFLGQLVLSCSDFDVSFQGGPIPLGCQAGFLRVNGPDPGTGLCCHEVGGAGVSGGSTVLTPEPSTLLLIGTGLLGAATLRRNFLARNSCHPSCVKILPHVSKS